MDVLVRYQKSQPVGQISVILHASRDDNELIGAKVPAVKGNVL